jgi:Protein of unknown function (DUF3667)
MATLLTPSETVALPAGAVVADACVSCGARLAGEYCHACGERRRTPEQLSLRHSLREFADDVFDLDSRGLRSLRLLLFQPGGLTLEFIRGRRRPYVGPLRMYLTVFAVTLFASMLFPQTATRNSNSVEALVKQLVHSVAVRRGMTDAAAEKALTQTTAQHVTWLSLLIPLVFAAFLFAVFHRRRRWFGEHLVFATHVGTFNFLVALILLPLQVALLRFGPTVATTVAGVVVVPMFAWMMVAVRRVYGTGWPGAVGWSFVLFLALAVAQFVAGALALCTAALSILWFGV